MFKSWKKKWSNPKRPSW